MSQLDQIGLHNLRAFVGPDDVNFDRCLAPGDLVVYWSLSLNTRVGIIVALTQWPAEMPHLRPSAELCATVLWSNNANNADVDYFRQQLFVALKVPSAYMGYP